MALVSELICLKRRDLYLFGNSPGGDWDILIGRDASSAALAYEADRTFGTVVRSCWSVPNLQRVYAVKLVNIVKSPTA
jgi:hypothetical protein